MVGVSHLVAIPIPIDPLAVRGLSRCGDTSPPQATPQGCQSYPPPLPTPNILSGHLGVPLVPLCVKVPHQHLVGTLSYEEM